MAEPIENDHIPLAFLLGARASLYAPKAHTTPATSRSISGSSSSSSSSTRRVVRDRGHAPPKAAGNRVELFSPKTHPRAREEEARRVLQQTLLARDDGANESKGNWSGASSTPTSVLQGHKDLVLRQVLENRAAEQAEEVGDREPRLRRDKVTFGGDDENFALSPAGDLRAKDYHSYERADKVVPFLDVAGQSTRIPLLSTQEAKQIHQRAMKRQSERRASRLDEMHALLLEQQQLTKQVLRMAPASLQRSKQVSRVDLGVDIDIIADSDSAIDIRHEQTDGSEDNTNAQTISSLTALRELHEIEQQQLHERVQEKRHTELLTRQQLLAFRQEQKRVMIGRAKNVKRPSFLATLQLDKTEKQCAAAPGDTSPLPPKDLRGAVIAPLRTVPLTKHNQVEESESSLGRLQRDIFLQSEEGGGRQLFGGGFKKATRKSVASDRARASDVSELENPLYQASSVALVAHTVAIAPTKKQEIESTQQQQQHQQSAGHIRRTLR